FTSSLSAGPIALFILSSTHSIVKVHCRFCFLFFNDTATTEIYTLSLHDALPISGRRRAGRGGAGDRRGLHAALCRRRHRQQSARSEEHTSELQSRENLVCRLLLEKKKKKKRI